MNAGQRKVRQHVMRIERLVPCPPKELWWALIENAEATERGVMLRLALPGGVSQVAGKITRYESPTLLECCWDGNVLRWELEPRCEGTTHVVFTHGPGTEHLLDELVHFVDGLRAPGGVAPAPTRLPPAML